MSLEKIAVVTGACGGIGKQITARLIHDGFRVVGLDINENQLQEMAQHYDSQFMPLKVDLTSAREITQTFEKINPNLVELMRSSIMRETVLCQSFQISLLMNLIYKCQSIFLPHFIAHKRL